MTRLTNEMADLAEQVKEANEAVIAAGRTGAEHAMKAGRFLIDAKARCGHGNWLPFLERSAIHERTAQRYMTLARSGLNPHTVSDLGGIGAALAFIREWKLPVKGEALAIVSRTAFDERGGPAFRTI